VLFKKNLPSAISGDGMCRRDFLTAGLITASVCLLPCRAISAVSKVLCSEREISFYNIHTGEDMKAVYWESGNYVPQALSDINHILRDYRTGEVKKIDSDLLDLLFALRQKLQSTSPFHIISGYRSPETNSFLSMITGGIAKHSMHIQGKAIDIRIPGYELKTLHRAALELQRGGVGYYPSSDFVHVDVGRVRSW
jgi:uncharacterized protein YcbK (DUF882 family)